MRLKLFGGLVMPLVLSALTGLQIAAAARAHRSLDEHLCHGDALHALWQCQWAAPTCSSTLLLVGSKGLGPSCRKSPAQVLLFFILWAGRCGIGCVWQWAVLCYILLQYKPVFAWVVLAALWKAAILSHLECIQLPKCPCRSGQIPQM